MYQITNNTSLGILAGMTGEMEKQAIAGALARGAGWLLKAPFKAGWWGLKQPFKAVGWGAKKMGISPAGAAMTGLFAAPVGISAATAAMPPGGLKGAVFGRQTRSSLMNPVKSPQDPLF